jgi:hypothetical protein
MDDDIKLPKCKKCDRDMIAPVIGVPVEGICWTCGEELKKIINEVANKWMEGERDE